MRLEEIDFRDCGVEWQSAACPHCDATFDIDLPDGEPSVCLGEMVECRHCRHGFVATADSVGPVQWGALLIP